MILRWLLPALSTGLLIAACAVAPDDSTEEANVADTEEGLKACGGIGGLPCPLGKKCVDDPNDNCDPAAGDADCIGVCKPKLPPKPVHCGGLKSLKCPDGQKCVDDPSDNCHPHQGGADCIGICIDKPLPSGPIFCGGFGALQCPQGYTCVDNPNDSCDPHHGGADCGGICMQ